MIIPSILFAACGQKTKEGIDIPTYFEKVTYQVQGSTSANGIAAEFEDFTHNKHDNQVKYTQITFTGKPAWLYKMTLEKITFDVFANVTEEVEIKITVTNVIDGNPETGSTTFTDKVSVPMVKDQAVKVDFNIGKVFKSNSSSTSIKLQVESSYYTGDNEETNLKFDVMNFKVHAKH